MTARSQWRQARLGGKKDIWQGRGRWEYGCLAFCVNGQSFSLFFHDFVSCSNVASCIENGKIEMLPSSIDGDAVREPVAYSIRRYE